MKSPDRDAADELAMLKERAKSGGSVPYGWYAAQAEDLEKQASELATLRRRVAEMETALTPFAAMHREGSDPQEIACKRGYASDLTLISSGDFAKASAALSPPTRKE